MPQRFPSQHPIAENHCAAFFVQFDPRVCWTGRGVIRRLVTLSLAGGAIDIEDRARLIQSDTARRMTPGVCWTGPGGHFALARGLAA